MTQELIANMLGVRREGVTEAAGKLQRMGLIKYSRGHIEVVDRTKLEKTVCACYAVVKLEFDRLLTDIPKGDPFQVLGLSDRRKQVKRTDKAETKKTVSAGVNTDIGTDSDIKS